MKPDKEKKANGEKITQETLEAKLREVADAVNSASQPAREAAWRIGLITAAVLVILAYFLGKRRGSRSRAYIEVRSN